MRVESINGKKCIMVIVDDYSCYTWVYFLRTKDEDSDMIKKFIAQVQLNFKVQIQKVRIENGTEFKNATLQAHYEKLSIMQQFSITRMPQQDGVTPYELLRDRKPNVQYFHVFRSLCYPTTDREDLGKMKPKADIGIFIGYSESSRGFQIYNRKTRKIIETIHVKFDELTAMASQHSCLEPATNCFNTNDSSAEFTSMPSKENLDNLFGPIYEEYFEKRYPEVSINFAAQTTLNNEDTPSSSSIIVEDNEAPPLVSSSEEQISLISNDVTVESVQEDSADLDGNTLITLDHSPMFKEAELSSTTEDPSNMHEFSQVQPST
ncbi:retrovirus-related pol polyprotein from transposon TNT 1-94 [Tanacetum coccineum]